MASFDIQCFQPKDDPTAAPGDMADVAAWLNQFQEFTIEAMTTVPDNKGGPPWYVVVFESE
jgi:hypothetical protein